MIRLQELRAEKGIPQNKIASDLNITQQADSRYERGERELGYDILIRFADYFDVSVDYLLGHSTYYYPDNVQSANSALSAEEREILALYSNLDHMGKKYVRQTLEILNGGATSVGLKKKNS